MASRLQSKITYSLVAGFMAIAIIFTSIHLMLDQRQMTQLKGQVDLLLTALVERDREPLANEIFAQQEQAYNLRLRKMLLTPGVVGICLFDSQGHELFCDDQNRAAPLTIEELTVGTKVISENLADEVIIATFPVKLIGDAIGILRIQYSISDIIREQSLVSLHVYYSTLCLVACFGLGSAGVFAASDY